MTTSVLTVARCMAKPVITVKPTQSIGGVQDLLERHRIRHLPVVDDDGVLVGILTERDMIKAAKRHNYHRGLQVREVMATGVYTVQSDTSILEASHLMRVYRIGCLPVVDNGNVVGLLTRTSLLEGLHVYIQWVNAEALPKTA